MLLSYIRSGHWHSLRCCVLHVKKPLLLPWQTTTIGSNFDLIFNLILGSESVHVYGQTHLKCYIWECTSPTCSGSLKGICEWACLWWFHLKPYSDRNNSQYLVQYHCVVAVSVCRKYSQQDFKEKYNLTALCDIMCGHSDMSSAILCKNSGNGVLEQ